MISRTKTNAQQSVAASRADCHISSKFSLPIISHRLDRILTRLRILATHLVPQAGFGFINNVYVL